MEPVLSGIDQLLAHPPAWKLSRIGLVTNHAAVTCRYQPARLALLEAGFNVVKLYSPEHGLDISGADGQLVHDGEDLLTGLPIVSLYGTKLAPAPEDLEGIDLLLFDIPDVGCRFYTYLWTLTLVMEACASCQKPFVIADRPNPISGNLQLAEGPLLDETCCQSFIGRWRVPVRHSCTFGELAGYFNTTRKIGCSLEIISCVNWRRSMFQPEGSWSFVPASPAMPSFESALLYPGLGLLEATNLSEGRGTATPFRVAGAPWMQAAQTAALFNRMISAEAITGGAAGSSQAVMARPVVFTPCEGKYAGQRCQGVMLHVGDPARFQPVSTAWLLIRLIKDRHPGEFEWAAYPTQVNPSGQRHLDLLTGLPQTERLFEIPSDHLLSDIKKYTAAEGWEETIRPYLLYR